MAAPPPKRRLGSLARPVAMRYALDLARRPLARSASDVPAFPWSVTPEWLTLALCPGTDAEVVGWEYEPVSRGTTCRGRFHLEYRGADADQHPATVFVKSCATFRTRLLVGAVGAIRAETRFYREIKPSIDVPGPMGYFGASDRRSGRGILLLEDITASGKVTFGDNRSVLVDRRTAATLVDALANLHGSLLASPRFAHDLGWVMTSLELQRHLDKVYDFERRIMAGFDRAGDLIPRELLARRNDIHRSLVASLELDARYPCGLVHSDVHAGNWFITDDGQIGLYDWAGVARGQGVRDLVYALCSSLSVEDRRAWERDLVEQYADTLSRVSAVPVAARQIWAQYRQQPLHALCFWLYTLGRGALQPTMQADSITRLNVARMAQAVVELDTLALVAI